MTGSTILKVSLLILSLGCKREDNDFDIYNPYYVQTKYEDCVKPYLRTYKSDSIGYSIHTKEWYLNNNIVLSIFCDESGDIEGINYYFPYKKTDFLSSINMTYYKIDNNWVSSEKCSIQYDTVSKKKKWMKNYDENKKAESLYEFKSAKYDSNGPVIEDSCTLFSPYLKRKTKFFYNHKKQLIRREVLSSTTRLPHKTIYEYDLDGELKQEHSYFEPNQNQDEEIISYFYLFIYVNKNEKVKITYHQIKYKYYRYEK